jgi:hypothetical protein
VYLQGKIEYKHYSYQWLLIYPLLGGRIRHNAANKILLFKHKKIKALKNLKEGINLHYAQESEKEPYKLLIAGYIAELEDKADLALQYYDSVISWENSPLLEEALLRVVSISIKQDNHSNALLALK